MDSKDSNATGKTELSPLIANGKESARSSFASFMGLAMPPFVVYAIGVFFFTFHVGWPFLTANYVSAQMITTIGYGDFTVDSESAKIFMAFYAISVIVVLAYYNSLLIGKALDWETEILRKKLRQLEVEHGFAISEKVAAKQHGTKNLTIAMVINFTIFLLFGCVFFRFVEHCTCSYGLNQVGGCKDEEFDTCANSGGFVKDWASSFYMSAITLTTIGFGDYQPRTVIGRIIGILWMIMGTACTGSTLTMLSQLMFEREKEKKINEVEALSIDEASFRRIDKNHDGKLSRGEFIAHNALKYGLIQEDLLNQLNAMYDQLDPSNSNEVTIEMIKQRKPAVAATP